VIGQDYVFHLAGRILSASRRTYDLANHQLTRDLVQACLRKNPAIKRFVYISSISAAGPSSPGQYVDETRPCAPTSEYGRSKLRGEEAVQKIWDSIPATIIRPPNVYGPRQQETEKLIKIISKRIVPLLKQKEKTTSLIYVKDLVEGIIQSAFSPKTRSRVYYLTDGKGYSWREIILTLKRYLLGDSLYVPLPEEFIFFSAFLVDALKRAKLIKTFFGRRAWKAMVQTPWLFSPAKARKDFGFMTKYNLEEGIRETVDYYKIK
jgi:nucleoside-diphosphate-sugar epimerase